MKLAIFVNTHVNINYYTQESPMKKYLTTILLALLSILMTACSDENNNQNNNGKYTIYRVLAYSRAIGYRDFADLAKIALNDFYKKEQNKKYQVTFDALSCQGVEIKCMYMDDTEERAFNDELYNDKADEIVNLSIKIDTPSLTIKNQTYASFDVAVYTKNNATLYKKTIYFDFDIVSGQEHSQLLREDSPRLSPETNTITLTQ